MSRLIKNQKRYSETFYADLLAYKIVYLSYISAWKPGVFYVKTYKENGYEGYNFYILEIWQVLYVVSCTFTTFCIKIYFSI